MKHRIHNRSIALLCLLAVMMTLSACRLRTAPDTSPDFGNSATTTTTPTQSDESLDTMGEYAWEVYETALQKEQAFTGYDVVYESKQTAFGITKKTSARIQRVQDGEDGHEILLEVTTTGKTMEGYYKSGVGYFQIDGDRYWLVTDEENFMSRLGFSESLTLSKPMFSHALVAENGDGTKTATCPLSEDYALEYAKLTLGSAVSEAQVSLSVTVDETGAPVEYQTSLSANTQLHTILTLTTTNRYEAVNEAVTLTPPGNLDSYREFLE